MSVREQPTEEEYERMQELCDHVFVTGANYRCALHLFEDCDNLTRESADTHVVAKDPYAFPYEYYPICKYCLEDYRTTEMRNDKGQFVSTKP